MSKRLTLFGAVVASTALTTTRIAASTEPRESTGARTRYEDAMAEVLARRRALVYPPSWEVALAAWREVAGVTAQDRPAVRFDIPPGPLRGAISEFERITRLRITLVQPAFNDVQSPGVSGVYTPEQALSRILESTGLTFTFSAADTITVDMTVRESVSVTGRAVLSSPKLPQPLRDIPQTVSVIPKEVMRAQAATSLRDVLRNVPGITFQAGEGGGGLPGDTFTMRGFSAGNDMFIDGVRDVGGYSRDAFNLEQVEVTKGPSSSIAGRGTTGGAINQVTKSPQLGRLSEATIAAGHPGAVRGTVDWNEPIGAEERGMSLRLNAMWGDSSVAGRDVVKNRSWVFDLDNAIQSISRDAPAHPSAVQLTAVYHNLLRRWAEM